MKHWRLALRVGWRSKSIRYFFKSLIKSERLDSIKIKRSGAIEVGDAAGKPPARTEHLDAGRVEGSAASPSPAPGLSLRSGFCHIGETP